MALFKSEPLSVIFFCEFNQKKSAIDHQSNQVIGIVKRTKDEKILRTSYTQGYTFNEWWTSLILQFYTKRNFVLISARVKNYVLQCKRIYAKHYE